EAGGEDPSGELGPPVAGGGVGVLEVVLTLGAELGGGVLDLVEDGVELVGGEAHGVEVAHLPGCPGGAGQRLKSQRAEGTIGGGGRGEAEQRNHRNGKSKRHRPPRSAHHSTSKW